MLGKMTIHYDGDKLPRIEFEGEIPFRLINATVQQIRLQYMTRYVVEKRKAEEKAIADKKRSEEAQAKLKGAVKDMQAGKPPAATPVANPVK